ncbi:hypothetical protein [Candidatus Palauibacter polyketidifaciens]|nr:hypothetical protein [Candidatus Palauibacter polyketidifaciens]
MTRDETEALSLLQRYADDPNGRAVLHRMADSIEVANRRARLYWTPTVRKSKGWTVNLRISRVFAITLRDDKVEIALVAESVDPAAMTTLIAAGDYCGSFVQEPGSERYALDWAEAAEQWESFERAHHEMLEYEGTDSKISNPEAHAVIDFLKSTLDRDLPYPERKLSAPVPSAVGRDGSGMGILAAFADSDAGKAILRATARSIEVANAESHAGWGTSVDGGGTYVALNVGNACAIRLHEDRVRILLLPERLDAEVRKALDDLALHAWDRPRIPGAHNFELGWQAAADIWGSLEDAHHAALTASTVRKNAYRKSHSNEVVDFLNRELGLALPYPSYRTNPDTDGLQGDDQEQTTGSGRPQFRDLVGSFGARGLLFPTETVANYVLALQTKRFAILTGISGTGKTQIAMAVARSFPATIQDQPAEELDRSSAPDDAVRMTARPFHFKWRQIILPVRFAAEVESFVAPTSGSASRMIQVAYPGGLTKLRFYREPNRNVTWLLFAGAHDFRDWYLENLQPGDQFYISFGKGETPDDHRIEFRLGDTEVAERKLDNRVVVPVRPDWVDNRGLLGYLNPITGAYSMTPFLSLLLEARDEEARAKKEDDRAPHPFFVVLDEMNLARVEHYFSDFLSALESDEPISLHDDEGIEDGSAESGVPVPRQLRVPNNVFFTGTVNVDETTYMFSPKVLDRAFTIEFDQVDLEGYTDGVASRESGDLDLSAGKDGALRFTPYEKPDRNDWLDFTGVARGRYARILLELHAILEEEHRHFGYRVANEIARFVNLAREQSANGDESVKAAFDLALLQKVLPKFHGTQQELESLLEKLFDFAVHGGERRRGDADVRLDEWTVVNGRLRPNGTTASRAGVPAGTSQGDADGSAGETEGPQSEEGTDAGDGAADGPDPEFPRTAAKIWRMLRRLRQRGFTAFIE